MERKEHFLKNICKIADYEIEPITQDASSRRYWRIAVGKKTFILMDGDPKVNRYFEFVEMSKLLNSIGVRAPKILELDMEDGFMLLEDFGNGTFTNLFNEGKDEEFLYRLATEALVKIAHIEKKPDFVKEFTDERIINDFCLFTNWYCPCVLGKPLSEEKKEQFVSILKKLLPNAKKVPYSISIWDYHVDNLMLLEDGGTCGVLDFQDALWGPVTYDLASLLEDRREAPEHIHAKMKEVFYQGLKGIDKQDFENSFAFFSMLRHMRVLGRFTTLTICKGRTGYGKYVPHIWKMLERTLQHHTLVEMKKWVDEVFVKEKKVAPKRKPISKAIILAAGLGTRMKDLTADTPKPLIKVNGKALIDYKFEMLKEANISDVVVNVSYHREKMKEHLKEVKGGFNIMISEEDEPLETGGGVKKALPMLGDEAFFTINSDEIWFDSGVKSSMWRMIDAWEDDKMDIMLLLVPMDKVKEKGISLGNYRINADGLMERNANKEQGFEYFYPGTALVHPRIFKNSPEGKFSMRDLYDEAQAKGRLAYVINYDDVYHVGTPEDLELTEKELGSR